jgi:glycosyltransferase involved in cell wall biosynthesis
MTAASRAETLRILIELNSADLRIGAVNDALDLAELTASEGARFILCGPLTPALREEAARRGADTLDGSSRTFRRSRLPLYVIDVLRWMRRLASIQPHVVHLNYPGYGPSLACAARLCGIPVVARAGPMAPTNPANRWVAAYLANCQAQAAELLASPLAGRVVIAGDLFRPARLHAAASEGRPLPPKAPEGIRVVFLGQLVERKGIHVLVDALSRLPGHVDLVLAGGDWSAPGYPQDLKALAARSGVEGRIHFENHRADVAGVLRSADMFVLPSFSEARPRSIIEAMSMGLPVIASEVGGIPSLVHHGETGLLVPAGDAAALAGAIAALAASAADRQRMGRAGRARAERECRADDTARAYLRTYRSLVVDHATRSRVPCSGEL